MKPTLAVSYLSVAAVVVVIDFWLVFIASRAFPDDWYMSWYAWPAAATLVLLFAVLLAPALMLVHCVLEGVTIEELLEEEDDLDSEDKKGGEA